MQRVHVHNNDWVIVLSEKLRTAQGRHKLNQIESTNSVPRLTLGVNAEIHCVMVSSVLQHSAIPTRIGSVKRVDRWPARKRFTIEWTDLPNGFSERAILYQLSPKRKSEIIGVILGTLGICRVIVRGLA
jgi:hypothetical protein